MKRLFTEVVIPAFAVLGWMVFALAALDDPVPPQHVPPLALGYLVIFLVPYAWGLRKR